MNSVINTNLPVDTSIAPIKINEEDQAALSDIEKDATELDAARRELGRLYQMMNNVRDKTDGLERSLNTKRKELISKYNVAGGGKWVIDFNEKEFIKLLDTVPNPA